MTASFRFTCRTLLKSPGYSSLALITLALGVGLTTAVFAIFESVILRPLPFPKPQELVAARVILPAYAKTYPSVPVNARFYLEWSGCPAFANLALVDRRQMVLTGQGDAERLTGASVSANLLATLGLRPLLGSDFAARDSEPNAPQNALIGEALWRRLFAGNPSILGKGIVVDQKLYTVIGVLPKDFRIPGAGRTGDSQVSPKPLDLLVAKRFTEDQKKEIFGAFNFEVIGRLAKGQSIEQALAQMDVTASRLAKESGESMEARSQLLYLQDSFVGEARQGLTLLFCAVAAVLLIACLNLAVLSLSRSERQTPQYEIRASLGAGRLALFSQAISESAVLSVLGGALGLLVASLGLGTLVSLAPPDLPRLDEISLRFPSVVFASALTLLCALLFGLVPSLRLSKTRNSRPSDSRNASAGASSAGLQNHFVGIEVALGTVLLSLGLLFAQSYAKVLREDRGYNAPRVESALLQIPGAKYTTDEAILAFDRRVLSEVATLPGVEASALSSSLPMQGETWIDSFYASDDPKKPSEAPTSNVRFVSEAYFDVLGVPLLEGRTFSEKDQARKVAIVSRRLASILWPDQHAVGKRITRVNGEVAEVIGVVGDTRVNADQPAVSLLYYPYWEYTMTKTQIVFRYAAGARPQGKLFHSLLRRIDPDLPAPALRSMDDLLAISTAGRRFMTLLCDGFALAALALAALGVFGVLSYRVARRRKEIGIRSALGAAPSDLLRLIMWQGMKPVIAGLTVGIAAAIVGVQLVKGLLYGAEFANYLLLVCVPFLLSLVGAAACLMPAAQAMRIAPSEALRDE